MGTFSATHWGLAIALLAGLAAFVYLAGSLLWAGAKATGSKWKLVMLFVLLPIAIAGVAGIIGASNAPQPSVSHNPFDDPNYGMELLKK